MRLPSAVLALFLAACAATAPLQDVRGFDALLLGEQHDADAHRALQERYVGQLVQGNALGALALEMAERGRSTAGLPRDASAAQVQQALQWNTEAWPWDRYGGAVMAAVRAGAPVLGANLPRSEMRAAMADASLDRLLPGPALKAQQQAIRIGHCELLPETQITPMTRVQIARDRAMAQTIAAAAARGKTVVLLAGAGHVEPEVGVPRHLPEALKVQPLVLPPVPQDRDHCAELREKLHKPKS
jgi:uncharacterized iron-regulated protein